MVLQPRPWNEIVASSPRLASLRLSEIAVKLQQEELSDADAKLAGQACAAGYLAVMGRK